MSENEKRKNKFRRSNRWNNFRKELKREQKTDPVTGSRLTTTATCHHKSLKPEEYELLSRDRQVMLNSLTHKVLHFIYGDTDRRYDWRKRILALIRLCKEMDRFNGRQQV